MIRAVTTGLAVLGCVDVPCLHRRRRGAAPPGSQCGEESHGAPDRPRGAVSCPRPSPTSTCRGIRIRTAATSTRARRCRAALVTVQGATGSSPEQALLFHDGEYVGTATAAAYPYTSLNEDQSADDTVVLGLQGRPRRLHGLRGTDLRRALSVAERPRPDARPAADPVLVRPVSPSAHFLSGPLASTFAYNKRAARLLTHFSERPVRLR